MATAATRMVDLEIMIDMFGGCVCVCVCVCVLRGVCVYVCVYLCVWTWMCMSVLESFQNARREASSGLLSFRARTPIEDAYRGRPLVSRVLFPPFALGWDPDRSRRDLSGRTDVGEEARGRSGPVEKSPQPTSTHSLQPEGGSVPPVAYARSWPCLQQSYGYM